MAWRAYRYAVSSQPRADGQLSIVKVERAWKGPDTVILSDGQQVISRWERLTSQCEIHCQWQTAITPRLWPIKDAVELIRLGRLERASGTEGVF